jgi:3-phosphoshikimate 1-carboxyvinyltransferase
MDFFDSVLPQLGVTIKSTKGKLPLTIRGPLIPANIEIDGSISSQFLTGLLMAYSAAVAENVSIRVNDLRSRPYIDLTLSVMRSFGLPLPENRDYKEFYFSGSNEPVMARKTVDYFVEADWSGAAFLLVAGAIAGPLQLRGLDPGSAQADKAILDGLLSANAVISMDAKGIKIRPGEMNGFDFNATDCPDLFPPLTALALYCKGETKIKGVHRLAYKESNRAEALKEEFEKMGAEINISGDHLIIKGKASLKEAELSSHHDHRIAMALAVAALGSDSPVTIHDAESVNKSYPDFFRDLKMLGAGIKLSDTGFSDGYRIDLNFSE